jgi:hypothetical protein
MKNQVLYLTPSFYSYLKNLGLDMQFFIELKPIPKEKDNA